MNRLVTLEWIPFNNYGPTILSKGAEEYEDVKLLFESYGWPESFDGAAFDAAAGRWREFRSVRSIADAPTEKVKYQKQILAREREMLRQHADRFRNGLWDGDPHKAAREVQLLERELEGKVQGVKYAEGQLAEAVGRVEVLEPGAAMENAWRGYLQDRIDCEMRDLEFFLGDGKGSATEEKLRELNDALLVLKRRIGNVESLPKTVMDTIKPRH